VNVFAVSLLEARRVDSGTTDTNFFTIGGLLEAWRVNSGTGNTGFLAIGWLELGRVYSCLIDTDLFTISGLELGSVLTFSEVKLGLVFVTTVVKVDGDISVVASAVWKIDVDVSFGVLVFGSD
jgi:ABC-type glucose/galactose transport system permease subunit